MQEKVENSQMSKEGLNKIIDIELKDVCADWERKICKRLMSLRKKGPILKRPNGSAKLRPPSR